MMLSLVTISVNYLSVECDLPVTRKPLYSVMIKMLAIMTTLVFTFNRMIWSYQITSKKVHIFIKLRLKGRTAAVMKNASLPAW